MYIRDQKARHMSVKYVCNSKNEDVMTQKVIHDDVHKHALVLGMKEIDI